MFSRILFTMLLTQWINIKWKLYYYADIICFFWGGYVIRVYSSCVYWSPLHHLSSSTLLISFQESESSPSPSLGLDQVSKLLVIGPTTLALPPPPSTPLIVWSHMCLDRLLNCSLELTTLSWPDRCVESARKEKQPVDTVQQTGEKIYTRYIYSSGLLLLFADFLRLIMLCLKHLGAISVGLSLIRQAGKLDNGNGRLFRKSLIRLMRTSAALAQHPRHQHVILDTETEMDG